MLDWLERWMVSHDDRIVLDVLVPNSDPPVFWVGDYGDGSTLRAAIADSMSRCPEPEPDPR